MKLPSHLERLCEEAVQEAIAEEGGGTIEEKRRYYKMRCIMERLWP